MPRKVDYFPMRSNSRIQFPDFFAKMAELGIDENFISSISTNIQINTKGTWLEVELEENRYPGDDMHFYTLKYNDIEVASTRQKMAYHHSYTYTFVHTLYGLPNWLLKSEMPAHLKEPKPQCDLLFPLGGKRLEDLQMQHLAYVNITASHLVTQKGLWYLKLTSNKDFSINTEISTKFNRYSLQCKGVEVVETYQFHENMDHMDVDIDHDNIARINGSLDNLLHLPTCTYNNEYGTFAHGTIEGCVEGILNNQYSGFYLETPYYELCNSAGYDSYNENNKKILFDAFKKSSILREVFLPGKRISELDLKAFIDIFNNRPNFKKLDLLNCIVSMREDEFQKLIPELNKMHINFNGACTIDNKSIPALIQRYNDQQKSIAQEEFSKSISKNEISLINKERENSGIFIAKNTSDKSHRINIFKSLKKKFHFK